MPTGEEERNVRWLDLRLAETLCHSLAGALSQDRNEPMPAFRSADLGRLEACLKAPQQAFGDFEPFPGLEEKAAALLYYLVKGHPFPNGNKRFATAAYLVFLALNGWWPTVAKADLIALVESVAASEAREHRTQIERVAAFTRERVVRVEEVIARFKESEARQSLHEPPQEEASP